MREVRQIRLLVQRRGSLWRVCKVRFAAGDASVYLIPYSRGRRYFYGGRTLAEQKIRDGFVFSEGIPADQEPHLSLHESGMVQVYSGTAAVAGPLHIPPLASLRGQHVASVSVDAFEVLPKHEKKLSHTGREVDLVVAFDDSIESARIAVFVNGLNPTFDCGEPCHIQVPLKRSTLSSPLYLCFKPIGQRSPALDTPTGVTVIAGWDPTTDRLAKDDYLFIRGA